MRYIFAPIVAILALTLIATPSTSSAQSADAGIDISNSGLVTYSEMIFQTDFSEESVYRAFNGNWGLALNGTWWNTNPGSVGYHWISLSGGEVNGKVLVTEENYRSAPKSLRLEIFDSSVRGEQKITYQTNLVVAKLQNVFPKKEYSIGVWFYIPSSFRLNSPTLNRRWFNLIDITKQNEQYGGNVPEEQWSLGFGDWSKDGIPDKWYLGHTTSDTPIPLDQWFHIVYYCKKDETNGRITIYLNDEVLFDLTGVQTAWQSGYAYKDVSYYTTVGQIYFEGNDPDAKILYLDDLTLFAKS